jgi:phage baseplate assembly protein W
MLGMNVRNGRSITNDLEHIKQSIADIITTPVGTRIMRRTYGSMIPELIDYPINATNILRIYAATAAAIMQWEPRFKISSIKFEYLKTANVAIEITGSIETSYYDFSIPLQSLAS